MSIFKWGVLLVALLVGAVALGAGVATAHDSGTEVRITAMRLDDGRVEFALQEREGEGWGERILPRGRFFPTTSVGRWLNSTPITVGVVETIPTTTPTPTPTGTATPTATSTPATPQQSFSVDGQGLGSDLESVSPTQELTYGHWLAAATAPRACLIFIETGTGLSGSTAIVRASLTYLGGTDRQYTTYEHFHVGYRNDDEFIFSQREGSFEVLALCDGPWSVTFTNLTPGVVTPSP